MNPIEEVEIAVIGGSGFYELFEDPQVVEFATAYGPTSSPITVGTIGGRSVAFIARHGQKHDIPAHRVPYRANIAALQQLGTQRIFATCAAGSLQPTMRPGEFVVCDQLVDLTSGRDRTFFDDEVNHISFSDPYCPELRIAAISGAASSNIDIHETGTVVTICGPRFSTRAESTWYRNAGWDLVNMTQCPEAALAREAGICYGAVALVTDFDSGEVGKENSEEVSMDEVFAMLKTMVAQSRQILAHAIAGVSLERGCRCAPKVHI